MRGFYYLTFGCRASQADGAALKGQLLRLGLEETSSAARSEVALLNTCTVTAAADAEVRQVIRRIHRENPACKILVTGCYAQRAPGELAELPGVTWVVGNSHKHLVAGLLDKGACSGTDGHGSQAPENGPLPPAYPHGPRAEPGMAPGSREAAFGLTQILVGAITDEFHFAPVLAGDRTRPTLKVQDGCNARCSFCIIPTVRGGSRSLPPRRVIDQIRELEGAGTKEVVLSGINLGSYGRDLDRSITFLGLVERILGETSVARVRISSIEPMDVSPDLIRLVAQSPRMADHFHVPLQSGSDRILRRMNRRYWTSQYAERLLAIADRIPGCGIGADIMVGFPGETEEDHTTSLRFIASLPLSYVHLFPFSARPGTAAAASADQVNGRVAWERSKAIRAVVAEKRQAFLNAQIGKTLSALTLEETVPDAGPGESAASPTREVDAGRTIPCPERGGRLALTSNYLKVVLPAAGSGDFPEGNILVNVRVGRVHEGSLYGFPDATRAG